MDASALIEVLLRTPKEPAVINAIGDTEMVAPDLINVEVLSAIRRLERTGVIDESRANEVVSDLLDTPLRRISTFPLLEQIWQSRRNITPYDAAYMALAGSLNCPLVSSDGRLGRTAALHVSMIVV